jgi:putative ABC transport system permease protein
MRLASRLLALGEGVVIALDSIRSNKVRAALTIMGIAVGVFVVTAMSAAVHGINAGVAESFAAAGPTTFYVTRWPMAINSCNGSADSCPWRNNASLTVEEAKLIAREPDIHGVIAHVGNSAAFKYKDRELPGASVDAYTPGWTEVDGGNIDPGRSFTDAENNDAATVIIVNEAMRQQFFPDGGDDAALGKELLVNGQPFRVIGVYHTTGNLFDNASKPKAIVPFETARRKLNMGVRWLDLTVKPRAGVPQDVAIDEAMVALRTHRQLKPWQENTFFVSTQEKVMELYNSTVNMFFYVMIGLSAVGLMVGGVGVVAIMMISVTERTREIGVRKALGATRGIILWQFLVEAATLTLIGAAIGLIVGGLITWLIRSKTPIDASMPAWSILLAVVASAVTGILFGLLPAARAARLDPVEALRYE